MFILCCLVLDRSRIYNYIRIAVFFPCKGFLVGDPIELMSAGHWAGWLFQESDIFSLLSFNINLSSRSHEYLAAISGSEVDGFRPLFCYDIYKATT